MLDPNSKSIFETETIDASIVNKRKRTALMLCFTSPHFTEVAKSFGLEQNPETGLAVPRPKRPETAQVRNRGRKRGGNSKENRGRERQQTYVSCLSEAMLKVNATPPRGHRFASDMCNRKCITCSRRATDRPERTSLTVKKVTTYFFTQTRACVSLPKSILPAPGLKIILCASTIIETSPYPEEIGTA